MNRLYDQLTVAQINKIMAQAPAPPILRPASSSAEILSCAVCLDVKPGQMLVHWDCSRLLCAQDALAIVSRETKDARVCPYCRKPTKDESNLFAPLRFSRPIPILCQLIDDIDYECEPCGLTFKYQEAIQHHTRCGKRIANHNPPAHIPTRGENPLLLKEVISNPKQDFCSENIQSVRQIVSHLNGRQICIKHYRKNHTAKDIMNDIANKSGESVDKIKLFKFVHEPIYPWVPISQVADIRGANHVAAFSDLPQLQEHTANLIFHEVGQHPFQPKRVPQNHEQEPIPNDWWGE